MLECYTVIQSNQHPACLLYGNKVCSIAKISVKITVIVNKYNYSSVDGYFV